MFISILETIGVFSLAAAGISIGLWFAKREKFWWVGGYVFPLIFLLAFTLAHRIPKLEFTPPLSWLMAGRLEFALYVLFIAMIFSALSKKVESRTVLVFMISFMIFFIMYFASPFYLRILLKGYFNKLTTKIDNNGVCLQSNGFTCGPASSVTALKKFGIDAEEGELAILATTTWLTGTPPDSLCIALNEKYEKDGIVCEFLFFNSLDELKKAGEKGIVNVLLDFSLLADHYVTVFEITDTEVIIGDPLTGRSILSHKKFLSMWRKCGILIQRKDNE